jgi:hypothetical protein
VFDANYFKSALQKDADAMGGEPVVEVLLVGGHVLRVRAVLDVSGGHVTLETYQAKGDLTHHRPRFGAKPERESDGGLETFRAVVAYESIAAVVLDPSTSQVRARPGFGST